MLAHVPSATDGTAAAASRDASDLRGFRELMCSSLHAELVDGHRFADEASSAYVENDESAARVCPVC
jgi:hypothetical protein